MKRFALILLALSIAAPIARAECPGFGQLSPMGFETLTVSSTAVGFTATKYAPAGVEPATMATVSVETNPARIRVDGGAPTTTVGSLVADQYQFEVCGTLAVRAFKAIRSGSSDSTFQVHFFRPAQ